MADVKSQTSSRAVPRLSLDTWAVLLALAAAALIRLGVISRVGW
jgi:hypothetical protein